MAKDRDGDGQPNTGKINPAVAEEAGSSYGKKGYGSKPSVGQTKSYQSGSNAHGKHETKRTSVPSSGPTSAAGQPRQSSWNTRDNNRGK